jgi:hypothetical protein
MNCNDALGRLLVTDLGMDGSVDDPALQNHLGHCAQCATVAAQLRSDTQMLAAAVVAPRVRRAPVAVPPRLWFALPTLAMAAVAVFVMARSNSSEGSGTAVATQMVAADAPVPSTGTADGTIGASPSRPGPSRGVTSRRRVQDTLRVVTAVLGDDLRSAITPFNATPFVPERTIVVAAAIETPQPINHADAARVPVFSVDPMVGTRAMVARTADPRITVVWLY